MSLSFELSSGGNVSIRKIVNIAYHYLESIRGNINATLLACELRILASDLYGGTMDPGHYRRFDRQIRRIVPFVYTLDPAIVLLCPRAFAYLVERYALPPPPPPPPPKRRTTSSHDYSD